MAERGRVEHTFKATCRTIMSCTETEVHVRMCQIGPVRTGDTCDICFWRLECIAQPKPTNEFETFWGVTGSISKVVPSATGDTCDYESRLSTWKEACFGIRRMVSSIFGAPVYEKITPEQVVQPIITFNQRKDLAAVFFTLQYKQEELRDASGILSLDEKIDVSTVSPTFSGFQLNLRTSKNKVVRKISERSEDECSASSVPGPSSSGTPVKQSETLSPGSPSPSSKGSPSPSRSRSKSPFKRFSSPSRAGSPLKSAGGSSEARSGGRGTEQGIEIHGLIAIVQDMVLSLYNMDKDLLKFLIGRFTCEKLKELRFLTKSQARFFCKVHKIQDPFKSA